MKLAVINPMEWPRTTVVNSGAESAMGPKGDNSLVRKARPFKNVLGQKNRAAHPADQSTCL
jgi:hypothetical protein